MSQIKCTRKYSNRTLKRLFALSGNECAYPDCGQELLDDPVNHSQICHIAALNEEGLRFTQSLECKERNDYDNLILLCTKHHTIIDTKDESGLPLHSIEELKEMKQDHQDLVRERKKSWNTSSQPTLLGRIVRELISLNPDPLPGSKPKPFTIEDKIEFNGVTRYSGIIHKYAVFFPTMENLYDQMEAIQKRALLDCVNDSYLVNRQKGMSADDILDGVQSTLLEKLLTDGGFAYTEELEWGLRIIIVDSFMRCKILEDPTP